MTILYFQIFIIFTIYLASLLGKKSLIIACAAWTLFTLVNASFSSLILLQLITIWTCYALLKLEKSDISKTPSIKPVSEKPSASTPSPQPQTLTLKPIVSMPAENPPSAATALHSLDAINNAVTSFNDSISLNIKVQKATASLETLVFTEKLWTEKALERAQSVLKLDAWRKEHGEKGWAYYQEAHAKFSKALEFQTKVGVAAASPDWVLPDFTFVLSDGDTSLAIAIGAKIRFLQSERDKFLSDVVRQVWSNDPLRTAMRDELFKMGGSETWNCIARKAAEKNKPSARLTFGAVLGKIQTASNLAQQPGILGNESAKFLSRILIEKEIQRRVNALELPYLVHFTRVENLPSIMQHGLCSITTLTEKNVDFRSNDHLRLDGHSDAICLSVGHPNDKMFASYRWKSPEQGWVVLVVDRCVLWTLSSAFCNHNAADNRIRQQSLADLKTVTAFDNLFIPLNDLPSREESKLLPFDPTDVQAEVLVFDTLLPEFITGVVFSDQSILHKYKDCVADKPTQIHTESRGFLSARAYARKSGWTY